MGKCTHCGGSGRVRETHLNKRITLAMGPGMRSCPICSGMGRTAGADDDSSPISVSDGDTIFQNAVGFARMISWPLFPFTCLVAIYMLGVALFDNTVADTWPGWYKMMSFGIGIVLTIAAMFFLRRYMLYLGIASVVFFVLTFSTFVEYGSQMEADEAAWAAGAKDRADKARCERWEESGDLARLMEEHPDSPNARMCRKFGF